MFAVSMPKADTFSAFVETATKCFATAVAVAAEPGEQPLARALGVGHRLQRRERLRRHDEERLGRIEVARGFDEVDAVDVRHEPEGQRAVAVVAERLVGHDGPEVRAADADVDDVPDALAGVALPLAAADAVGEAGHPVEDGMHVGHDVLAVDDDRRVPRRAKRDVEDGPVLGDVDLLAAEHRVDPLAQPRLLRELHEQREASRR